MRQHNRGSPYCHALHSKFAYKSALHHEGNGYFGLHSQLLCVTSFRYASAGFPVPSLSHRIVLHPCLITVGHSCCFSFVWHHFCTVRYFELESILILCAPNWRVSIQISVKQVEQEVRLYTYREFDCIFSCVSDILRNMNKCRPQETKSTESRLLKPQWKLVCDDFRWHSTLRNWVYTKMCDGWWKTVGE